MRKKSKVIQELKEEIFLKTTCIIGVNTNEKLMQILIKPKNDI